MTSLFDTSTLLTFGLASAALVAAPGPGQAIVLTRTLQGGARSRLLGASGWAQWRERITGTLLIGLGIRLALQSRR